MCKSISLHVFVWTPLWRFKPFFDHTLLSTHAMHYSALWSVCVFHIGCLSFLHPRVHWPFPHKTPECVWEVWPFFRHHNSLSHHLRGVTETNGSRTTEEELFQGDHKALHHVGKKYTHAAPINSLSAEETLTLIFAFIISYKYYWLKICHLCTYIWRDPMWQAWMNS